MGVLGYDDGEIRFPWAKQANEAERRPPVPPSLAMSAVALSHSIWPDQDISYAEDPGVRRASEQSWVLSSSAPGPPRFALTNGAAGPEGSSQTAAGAVGPPPGGVLSTGEPSSLGGDVNGRQLAPKLEHGVPLQPFYPPLPPGVPGTERYQHAFAGHHLPASPYHPPPPHLYGPPPPPPPAHYLPHPTDDPARSAHFHLPHFPMGSAPLPHAYPYAPGHGSSGQYFDPAVGRYPPSAHYPYPARPHLPAYQPQSPSVDEPHRLQPIASSEAQSYGRPPPAPAPPTSGHHRPSQDQPPHPSPMPVAGPSAPVSPTPLVPANVSPDVKPAAAVKRTLSKKGKPSSSASAAASTSAAAAAIAEASTKRRRTLIACDRCRAHKLRCLGGRPCPACDKRGAGDECTYVAEVRRRGKAKKSRQAGAAAADGSEPDREADGLVPMDDVGEGGGGGEEGDGRGRTSNEGGPRSLSPRAPPVQVVDFAHPRPAPPPVLGGKRHSPTAAVAGRARESIQSDATTDGSGSGSSRTTGSVSSAAGSIPNTPWVGNEGPATAAAQDGTRGLIDRLQTSSVVVD